MEEINCLGDMCPIPIMKLQECSQIRKKGGSVKIVSDHSCTVESISHYCRQHGLSLIVTEPMNGIWELYIENPRI